MNVFRLRILRKVYFVKMFIGFILEKITPPWKMRKLHLYFYHEVEAEYFRKIIKIDKQIYNLTAKSWTCNRCGKLVFKGNIKDCIIMNCPHCGSQYTVLYDFPRLFKKRTLIRCCSSVKDEYTEKSEIDNRR